MVFYVVISHITPWSTFLGCGKKQPSIYKIQTTKAETPKVPISAGKGENQRPLKSMTYTISIHFLQSLTLLIDNSIICQTIHEEALLES